MTSSKLFDEFRPQGFVKEFTDFVLERVPTNHDFVENIGLTLLSSVLGNVVFPNQFGPVKLNIATLMIGPSGLAYKSLPLNNYMFPVLARITELIERPVIIPNRYSTEGLIEYLAHRDKKTKKLTHNEGVIARDEYTSMFKDVSKKNWLADGMEFISELYDGTIQKRYTKKCGLEEVNQLFVSFISATTPYLYKLMNEGFFVQGTGNRIIDLSRYCVLEFCCGVC